jgi:NADPH:quinone reductase
LNAQTLEAVRNLMPELQALITRPLRDVTTFRPGDEVFGMTGGVAGIPGSLAEFAAVDARLLAPKPFNLSMREVAALPLIFITAWEGLVDRVALRAGQKVLVLGGGGVGNMAVQIARATHAPVYVTTSASKADYMRGLSATPIDLSSMSVEEDVATFQRALRSRGISYLIPGGGYGLIESESIAK